MRSLQILATKPVSTRRIPLLRPPQLEAACRSEKISNHESEGNLLLVSRNRQRGDRRLAAIALRQADDSEHQHRSDEITPAQPANEVQLC